MNMLNLCFIYPSNSYALFEFFSLNIYVVTVWDIATMWCQLIYFTKRMLFVTNDVFGSDMDAIMNIFTNQLIYGFKNMIEWNTFHYQVE